MNNVKKEELKEELINLKKKVEEEIKKIETSSLNNEDIKNIEMSLRMLDMIISNSKILGNNEKRISYCRIIQDIIDSDCEEKINIK